MPNYIVRIFKSWNARDPERRWSNVYELHSDTLATPADMHPVALNLLSAEQAIHLHKVQFLSMTVSTWQPDSHPYDPESFNVYDLFAQGAVDIPEAHALEALDSNVTYVIKRQCSSGRSGRLFYRGCLMELDVQMGGDGRFSISTGSTFEATGAAFMAYKVAMDNVLPVGEGDAALALISPGSAGVIVRPVTDLIVGGVTINRRNHRYFDRAP